MSLPGHVPRVCFFLTVNHLQTHQWMSLSMSTAPYDPVTSPKPCLCYSEAYRRHLDISHSKVLYKSRRAKDTGKRKYPYRVFAGVGRIRLE